MSSLSADERAVVETVAEFVDRDVRPWYGELKLMIVGEGTNEIQRNVIAAQLISRGGLDR